MSLLGYRSVPAEFLQASDDCCDPRQQQCHRHDLTTNKRRPPVPARTSHFLYFIALSRHVTHKVIVRNGEGTLNSFSSLGPHCGYKRQIWQ